MKTRMQDFLDRNRIRSAWVERAARPPLSRRQMARWRSMKTPDIGLKNMIRVLRAVREVAGRPVSMAELFDLEPDHWPD
ncbi:MAG TPA: hypothetical protein VNA69_13190 [Thermoanaerobaculia bacterium]|nr:hypothetical protein [Thermoanaerobaculia bacterium]